MTSSIQRVVEQHAAVTGDSVALIDGSRQLTYRELNVRANAVARCLQAGGFRRGKRAIVALPNGADLAVILLAVLKAGGAYRWIDPMRSGMPQGISILVGQSVDEERYLSLDVHRVLTETCTGPNLPILTRPSDIACVLADDEGADAVLIPHATVLSLAGSRQDAPVRCGGEAGALDLWAGLLAGATLEIERREVAIAA